MRLALAMALALTAAAPLWGPGIVNTRGGGDSPFLLSRTLEMAENLRHGIIPARWMSHAAYDLGYPFFNHYAALPYYLSGGLTALGLSPLLAIQATQTLGFVLAALTMALWGRRLFRNPTARFLATAAYTFAPFHLVNVYVRGDSLSEFYAFVWYPLILWALDRLASRFTARRVVTAALAYGALILTHNVSALIFSPFALLYALTTQLRSASQHPIRAKPQAPRLTLHVLRFTLPFLLGILLTAWFWLPAIAETTYGQMGPEFTEDYFNYETHFRSVDLVQRSLRFNYEIAGSADAAGPFAMGLVQAGLAAAGASLLAWRLLSRLIRRGSDVEGEKPKVEGQRLRGHRPYLEALYLLTGLALATVMITPWSRPLWKHLPLLETTQFPWRFLSVQALFTAAVTGALVDGDESHTSRVTRPASILLSALCTAALILAALLTLHPDRLPITAEDVTWDNLLLYESFTGNVGTTIRHEYLPRDVVPRLYISGAVVDGVNRMTPTVDGEASLSATRTHRTPTRQRWKVVLDRQATVAFPLHAWPGWQAKIDGVRADTYPMTGSGRLTMKVPGGEHTVTLRLRNTLLRTVALLISGLTFLASILWLARRRAQSPDRPPSFSAIFAILVAACALAFIPPALLQRAPATTSATFFDFVQMPYPHRGPVDFGVGRLVAADVPSTAAPGETVPIKTRWEDVTAPLTGTLRLVSPATPRHNVPLALTATTFDVVASPDVAVTLPSDLARGLYLLELRVHSAEGEQVGRTAQGRGMGPLYVGAVRVPEGPPLAPDAAEITTLGNGSLTLRAVEAQQPDQATAALTMTWSTQGTPRNWKLSLRLRDATGRSVVQQDVQPGYGYLPTTLWAPGEKVVDHLRMSLPAGLAPGDYTLTVITYLQATMEGGGEVNLPLQLTKAALHEPPNATLCEASGLRLSEIRLPDAVAEGKTLTFEAVWSAVAAPEQTLTARWTVLDTQGEILATTEGGPAPGTDTATWPRHAWVRAPVNLALPTTLPDGPYRLQLTLQANEATLAQCTVVETLPIVARARLFEPPSLPITQEASFGETLRLLGYDLDTAKNQLTLTLWWQATRTPAQDYKRFVHLYNVETGAVPAQDDAMPRDWTYPTSNWLAREVVSETVTLETGGLPPGEHRLGVGWYEPETGTRLPAFDTSGQRVPDDRLTLRTQP